MDLVQLMFVALLLVRSSHTAQVASEKYSMNLNSDCNWIGQLDVPRDQTTFLNGKAAIGSTRGDAISCMLQFGPQTSGDTLEVFLSSNSRINDCKSSLTISMSPGSQYELGCQSKPADFPKFEAQNGKATIVFKRPDPGVTNYYFQVLVRAYRTIDKEPPGGGTSSSDIGMIVGIIAGVVIFIVIFCVVCICCWRRRQESLQEKRQFINGGAAGVDSVKVGGLENGVYAEGVRPESPGSNRRLLGRKDGSSEDGGSSVDGRSRSALERFGPAPSRRRQNVGPNEGESERKRSAFQVESEVDKKQPLPQPRSGGLRRGGPSEDFEDIKGVSGNYTKRSPQGSPLMSDLRSNPKFRRSFHENEADADEQMRRLSDHTSADSQDSKDYSNNTTRRPSLPRVPRSPSRSPSPQRRGEKVAAIYRARPSSSVDAARLDSDRSEETPPIEERDFRDTRHVLRPNRGGRGQPLRGKVHDDDDDDNHDKIRRQQQKRRDKEDEERQRRRRQEEEEYEREEERRHKQEKKRKDEERQRREEEEECEDEKRRRKQERKKKEEDRQRKRDEEKEEDQRRRRAAKESDGSEYEGRFKKSASGRRSKGKGPRMGRSRSTGNALEELEERHQRSRSKSPGSVHSLNFLEGDDDETDLDSNYLPFRRAGSKTSLYTSRSSLYGRRRKNSVGDTMSVSSLIALDDTDSRVGDFDRLRMSQKELQRLFKSTGELEMNPESAQVMREVGTSTRHGGNATVYGRKTQAKGRHGKRYSRGTQTPPSRGGRERRDSVGSTKSGRSTSSRHKLKSRSRSRESLGGRRSRSQGRQDEEMEASDDSSVHSSRRSAHSSHRPKKSHRSTHDYSSASDVEKGDDIADDQSVAPSNKTSSTMYNAAASQPYSQFSSLVAGPGYPQMVYQPVVAPGGPPAPVVPPGMVYQMATPSAVQPQKPPIAAKPKPKTKPSGSRWNELVNLTDGMKQRRRQMGESITEDGTESVLSSMWSQPTYYNNNQHHQHQRVGQFHAPPSYTTAQHLADGDVSYSSNYADSSAAALTPPRNTCRNSYSPSESNV